MARSRSRIGRARRESREDLEHPATARAITEAHQTDGRGVEEQRPNQRPAQPLLGEVTPPVAPAPREVGLGRSAPYRGGGAGFAFQVAHEALEQGPQGCYCELSLTESAPTG